MANNKVFFTQKEVAKRWKISLSTLERWRWTGKGPKYMKFGNQIRYTLAQLREHERKRNRQNTSEIKKD